MAIIVAPFQGCPNIRPTEAISLAQTISKDLGALFDAVRTISPQRSGPYKLAGIGIYLDDHRLNRRSSYGSTF